MVIAKTLWTEKLEVKSGDVCVSVAYLDDEMLVPIVETFVFLGCDIFEEHDGKFYFQDAESFLRDGPLDPQGTLEGCVLAATKSEMSNMYLVSGAAEALVDCAGRRRRAGLDR